MGECQFLFMFPLPPRPVADSDRDRKPNLAILPSPLLRRHPIRLPESSPRCIRCLHAEMHKSSSGYESERASEWIERRIARRTFTLSARAGRQHFNPSSRIHRSARPSLRWNAFSLQVGAACPTGVRRWQRQTGHVKCRTDLAKLASPSLGRSPPPITSLDFGPKSDFHLNMLVWSIEKGKRLQLAIFRYT